MPLFGPRVIQSNAPLPVTAVPEEAGCQALWQIPPRKTTGDNEAKAVASEEREPTGVTMAICSLEEGGRKGRGAFFTGGHDITSCQRNLLTRAVDLYSSGKLGQTGNVNEENITSCC